MDLFPSAGAVPRDLGLVPAGAHIAPPASARRRSVDEEEPTARIGADAQPRRRVVGEKLGQRAGNRRSGLVEAVADLRERVAGSVWIALDLVVVQPVSKDVVEVAQLRGGGVAALGHLGGDAMQDLAKVVEPLDPASGLVRVAAEAGGFSRQAAAADQPALPQPREQRGDVGDGIHRLATLVLKRVPEGDEELLGLIGLGKSSTIERHVTIVQPLTSYLAQDTVSL